MNRCRDFSVVVRVGATDITAAADRGDYLTPLRQVGQYTDVSVVTKRVGKYFGCRNANITAITPYNDRGVRGIYLLTNAAYAAATD
jgi:hypothetical protein